jgi:hypothetical protein
MKMAEFLYFPAPEGWRRGKAVGVRMGDYGQQIGESCASTVVNRQNCVGRHDDQVAMPYGASLNGFLPAGRPAAIVVVTRCQCRFMLRNSRQ